MRVDVFFGGQMIAQSDVVGRIVVVIDVLRASTSIATVTLLQRRSQTSKLIRSWIFRSN